MPRNIGAKYGRLWVIGIIGFLCLGGAIVYFGYQNAIYPLDKAMGYLSRAESAQTTDMMADYLKPVKVLLPNEGNPVWIFPTPRTDFGFIQNDLKEMLIRANSISSVETNSAAYSTGLEELHSSIKIIESNLQEAIPYIYASITNILLSVVWIAVIMLIFAAMRRGRSKFKEYETT
jgi:type II secretory pathway pseudopilin PulG